MPFVLNSSFCPFGRTVRIALISSMSDINSNVHVYELLENQLQHIGLDFVEYDIVTLDHRQHHVTDIHNHVMNDESSDQVEYNHVSFQFSYLMELFLNLIQPKDVDAVRLSMNYLDAEENHDSNILKMIQFTVLFTVLFKYLALQSMVVLNSECGISRCDLGCSTPSVV